MNDSDTSTGSARTAKQIAFQDWDYRGRKPWSQYDPRIEWPERRLAETDTRNETKIAWKASGWGKDEYWPADYLYSSKKEYFKYLNELNAGIHNGKKRVNKAYHIRCKNARLIELFATNLELTNRQQQYARSRFLGLNLRDLGLRADLVAYCTCAYVVHTAATDRKCHPNSSDERMDDFFREMRTDLGISKRQFHSTYAKIQRHYTKAVSQNKTEHSERQYQPRGRGI